MIKIFSALKAVKELREGKLHDFHLISIRDKTADKCRAYESIDLMSAQCLGMHTVLMHDLQVGEPTGGMVLPKREHIEPILSFAREKEHIVVHCTAGVSRSSAVAFLIECQRTGSSSEAVKVLNPKIHFPNTTIISIGEMILGMELMPTISKFNDMAAKTMFEKDNE
jgi:predicted protein tyrosine phosphatase